MAYLPALAATADPAGASTDPGTWGALILAVAPLIVLLAQWGRKKLGLSHDDPDGGPPGGPLAPVAEVPRADLDELLRQMARMDEAASILQREHAYERQQWAERMQRLEEEHEREMARLETALTHERVRREELLARVIRAETILSGYQQRQGRGESGGVPPGS